MFTHNYKFSIIIPTYNRATELDRCLLSVLTQTVSDLEIIVADDGSTDNTKDIVQRYKDNYPQTAIHYIYTENWGGPARPRNLALQHSSGEWICFLDSDDWYMTDRLHKLSQLKLDDYDFFYHDLIMIKNEAHYKTMTCRQLKDNCFYDLLFNLNTIATSSTCIRRSSLIKSGGFSEARDIIAMEDYDLWLRMAQSGIRFKYVPQKLGYYSLGDDNITLSDNRQVNRFKSLYPYFIDKLNNQSLKKKAIGAMHYQIARIFLMSNKTHDFLHHIWLSFINGNHIIKFKSLYQVGCCLKKRMF
ncbi:glycosyltransferase [Mucilaginibacter mali]|uniref:Glycosyltransferase n=1 Tax=Mucilaginibacter mali TaxID=2740462 RepID=A0A7D4PSV7_9SPHI|nr:glycosyltransferase [Mucilaginibacter mali]QKJ29408.1 glycosyltransferase [Mucilaginibacter mali]